VADEALECLSVNLVLVAADDFKESEAFEFLQILVLGDKRLG